MGTDKKSDASWQESLDQALTALKSSAFQNHADINSFKEFAKNLWARTDALEKMLKQVTQVSQQSSQERELELQKKFLLFQERYNQVVQENSQLRSNLARLSALEADVRKKNDLIAAGHGQIQSLRDELGKVTLRLTDAVSARDANIDLYNRAKAEVSRLNDMMSSQNSRILSLNDELAAMTTRVKELTFLSQAVAEKDAQIVELKKQVQQVFQSLMTESKTRATLQNQIARSGTSQEELGKLRASLEQKSAELKDALARAHRLEAIAAHQANDIENLRQINTLLQSRLSESGNSLIGLPSSKGRRMETAQ